MKRKKVIGLLLLLFVSLIIAAALLLQQEKQKLYVSPSGIITRLEAYEFSTNRVHYRLPKGTWRHKLLNLHPGAVRPQESHYVVSPIFAGEPLLSAAFSFKSPGDESVFALRVVLADENGNEFDPVGQQAGMSSGNPVYWATEVPAFPRRGSSVLLKVKQNADLIAEFRIPNPARGSYPQWKAKELPVVSGPNEFQAALLEFKTQFEDKYSAEQFPSTLCAFKVMENGSPTKNWLPGSGEIFDATGNHWRIFFDRRLSRTEGDTQFRTFMVRCGPVKTPGSWRSRSRRSPAFPTTN
jgi:hypothetical protein